MIKISHFGVHNAGTGQSVAVNANAGDTLLFQATRDLFMRFLGPIDWKLEALWKKISPEEVVRLNNESDALLIGGGGLFLRDQAGADAGASGWQWNCSADQVRKLIKPMIVFGVGYNRFRGQADFDPAFSEQITAVVEKSVFFGLRNNGSCEAIKRYLPEHLYNRIVRQPCPTTVAWYLYPDLIRDYTPAHSTKTMVINAAFDRDTMRFGNRKLEILLQIARVVKKYSDEGWNIILANHKPQDAELGEVLRQEGVVFESRDLAQAYPEDILKFYCDKDIVIGMRGHAQMIPFGLRRPIVSIISHDKMGWFLDDIGHPEWGVDVEDSEFQRKLDAAIFHVTEHPNIEHEIVTAQEKLWAITSQNMENIKFLLMDQIQQE